ncbi:Peroxisome biogenesis factor, partial [Globisporangium splendens]
MAGRGAFLAPVLLPMSTCFVNLPRAFVQAFLNGPDMKNGGGSTILELSWETVDGYVQRVCVGWIGGLVKDIRRILDVRYVLQQDHLEKMPQAFVGVHVVDMLPIAREVNVEPCTPDDWELIQLHAGLLETELLRQMCVVNDKQVTPIWVHQNILIRIRVSLPVGMEHARLSPNTEVIVAPKERPQPGADSALGADFYFEASSLLVVQRSTRSIRNETLDEVWIHPETLALLDGAVLPTAPLDSQEPPVVAIWSLDNTTLTSNSQTPSSQSETQLSTKYVCVLLYKMDERRTLIHSPHHTGVCFVYLVLRRRVSKCSVARLKCSDRVARGHIVLNRFVSMSLEVAAHSAVQLRVLKLPELAPRHVVLKVLHFSGNDAATSEETIRDAFLHWMESLNDGFAAHSGSIIRFDSQSTSDSVSALIDVEYDAEETLTAAQLEGIPIGAVEKYTLLGGRHGFMLSAGQVSVQNATDSDQNVLKSLDAEFATKLASSEDAAMELARSAVPYDKVKKAVRSVLYRDASMARVLLGVKTSGSPLIYGDRGSGKTTILKSLASELQDDTNSLSYSIFVECRNLRGLKMETVKAKLNEIFEEANSHAPSVVILDNLDALVPEEDESNGPANEQSRRIAELLLTLMQQARDRIWKSTLELNRPYKQETEKLKQSSGPSKLARQALLSTIASAISQKSVAVIASSRNDSSVHKSLRSCGLFDRPVQVTTPDAERREIVIKKMLQMKLESTSNSSTDLLLDPSIDYGLLASITEGYSLRDLSSATDRALHKTFSRYALQGATSTGADGKKVLQTDFVDGVKDFQPTSLIGVDLFKSTVKWSDVGGLNSVRTVLKDTLELPTRYGKLYDNTPIKLPAGMLLYGPPGCGKTLLASAVANECGLNFISVKGPEVLNKYIGASEQAIRDLFARAASAAPSVLFLDEFDSIAPRRGADNTGVTDRLVNQLLTFLDGVEGRKGVYVLAATSRPDMIDPALLRPGRLDKSLYCGFPTEEERVDILRAVGKDMELDEEAFEYLPEIAAAPKSVHFSGADLQALELVHEKLKPGGEHSKYVHVRPMGTRSHALSNSLSICSVILKRHVQVAFENAKPSTSESARAQFEIMYANFSRARTTDFSVATADTTADPDKLKSPITHQRTALA